jgi:hypothetical protein
VVQAEDFIVEIEHSMVARQAKVSMRGTDERIEDGWIEDHDGERLDLCGDYGQLPSCPTEVVHVGPPRTGPCSAKTDCIDAVPLRTLLRAAGIVDLDMQGDFVSHKRHGGTYQTKVYSHRFAGLILKASIEYDNTFSFDLTKFRYRYHVEALRGAQYKIEMITRQPNATWRTMEDHHGIQLDMRVTGTIGHFSFNQLLIQMVASIGLLTVSKVMVDLLGSHLQSRFRKAKFEDVHLEVDNPIDSLMWQSTSMNSDGLVELSPDAKLDVRVSQKRRVEEPAQGNL